MTPSTKRPRLNNNKNVPRTTKVKAEKAETQPRVFGLDETDAAAAHYRTEGYVVVRVLNAKECQDRIIEQWKEVLWRQPWKDTCPLTTEADPDQDPEGFGREVTGPFSRKRLDVLKKGWAFHRGFGACCDPRGFHLAGVWAIRQDPGIHRLVSELAGTEKLWVDINRSIQKLPGQGEKGFAHWDLDVFDRAAEEQEEGRTNVCGKVCYTASRFICHPRSHTLAFIQQVAEQYAPIYPTAAASATPWPKFSLDPNRPDPMKLLDGMQRIVLPGGCVIFWDDRLLHGVEKTPTRGTVEYGCYLGYFPAGSRPRYQDKTGIDEREDRLRSYRQGEAPFLWPSFDRIHYYPAKFQNFPKILQRYVDKIPAGSPHLATRVNGKGETIPDIVPVPDPNYRPPPLSVLGKRLLGELDWE